MKIGENIRKIMDETGYSFDRLAEKSGYDRGTIMHWVKGKSIPNPYALYDLACSMGVAMERFING